MQFNDIQKRGHRLEMGRYPRYGRGDADPKTTQKARVK
jgi:hypothetical protein